jgi:hypothetical protein
MSRDGHYGPPVGGKCDTVFRSLRDNPAQSRPIRLSMATRLTSFETGINHSFGGANAFVEIGLSRRGGDLRTFGDGSG